MSRGSERSTFWRNADKDILEQFTVVFDYETLDFPIKKYLP